MLAQRINTLALVGLVSLGCTVREKSGRADEVRLFYYSELATHSEETIEGAEEILGLDLIVTTDPLGTVIVFFVPDLQDDGESVSSDPCGRTLWAGDHVRTLAHELGHALGLGHETSNTNLMGPGTEGTDLDDEQIDTMRWSAWWLINKCGQ